jgi:GNAT superfamily N-acetyltransferase
VVIPRTRDEGDVVLADGGSAHLRAVRPEDLDSIESLYESLSNDSRRRRFLGEAPPALVAIRGADTALDSHHFALVAEIDGRIVGVADWYRLGDDRAEVAFTVREGEQHRGTGSLLLEHLADAATARGISRFVASTFRSNESMLQVFTDAGYQATWKHSRDVVEVTLDVTSTEASAAARQERERRAEARSVARLLSPRSVAVVGASDRNRTIGHALVSSLARSSALHPRAMRRQNCPHRRSLIGHAARNGRAPCVLFDG